MGQNNVLRQQVIMNFSAPPSADDIEVIARAVLLQLPEDLKEHGENIIIVMDELADETLESDLDLDSPYDLPALYRSAEELSPGVLSKSSEGDDNLLLFRRAILDCWAESGEDLPDIVRQIVIAEIAAFHDFADHEIDAMLL